MKELLIGASFILSTVAFGQTGWEKILKNVGMKDTTKHTYCTMDSDGNVQGENLNQRVRLASVSKLIVSLWAIHTLGPRYQFKTQVYIKDNIAHIQGNYDPYMGWRKMFFLLTELNKSGYKKFDKLTFNSDFRIYSQVYNYVRVRKYIPPQRVLKSLNWYFNTDHWDSSDLSRYHQLRNEMIASSGLDIYAEKIEMNVDTIEISNTNPLENADDVEIFDISSPELHRYLKYMNIYSNNHVADELFDRLGGNEGFRTFIEDVLDLSTEDINLYTGSGLALESEAGRLDNYATCSVVLGLMEKMEEELKANGLELTDVVSVLGADRGTLVKRLGPSFIYNSVVAKTGSLFHTSALAGKIITKKGPKYFSIFNLELNNRRKTSLAQRKLLKYLFELNGGSSTLRYENKPFFTFDYVDGEENFLADSAQAQVQVSQQGQKNHNDYENTEDQEEGNL